MKKNRFIIIIIAFALVFAGLYAVTSIGTDKEDAAETTAAPQNDPAVAGDWTGGGTLSVTFGKDGSGNALSPDGGRTEFSYSASGGKLSVEDFSGNTVYYDYTVDGDGKTLIIKNADGEITSLHELTVEPAVAGVWSNPEIGKYVFNSDGTGSFELTDGNSREFTFTAVKGSIEMNAGEETYSCGFSVSEDMTELTLTDDLGIKHTFEKIAG